MIRRKTGLKEGQKTPKSKEMYSFKRYSKRYNNQLDLDIDLIVDSFMRR